MITAIRNDNKDLYKDLFSKASEILGGFESVQTYERGQEYWRKDSASNAFKPFNLEGDTEDKKVLSFANALTEYGKLYVQIKDKDGNPVVAEGFVPELGITTLEEYYNWLPELKTDEEGKPTIFTKLPLDEAHFEINANTRAITIPNEFKKNGIAVQGDDLAEVVYFMVDRYFDAVDLNNTEIYIEWETPKGKSGTAVKAVSEPYLKIIDDENYYGKLIFGWALSEAITKESGTLKFAVRFIQRSEETKKIVYSFNTLTAQVTIHPNLGVDMYAVMDNADNVNDRLLERIQESEVVGGAKAKTPYFLTNLIMVSSDNGERDIAPNHSTGTYDLSVVATADDTGSVSYVWKRAELNADNTAVDAWKEVEDGSRIELVALTDAELAEFKYVLPANRTYHIKPHGEGATALEANLYDLKSATSQAELKKIFSVTEDGEFIPAIYENRAILTVTKYGNYKAEARNRIFNSLTKADSKVVSFRRPDAVKMVDNQIPNQHIIGTASAVLAPEVIPAVGDMTYQWYKAPEGKTLNSIVEITSWPAGSRITYGEDYIRICASNDQLSYKLQNVGEGGDANTYYGDIRFYYPEGAVKVKHASWNTNSSAPDMSGEEMCLIEKEHPGVDENGRKFMLDWLPFAYYTAENNLWVAYGWNKPFGEYARLFQRLQWFDENNNLLRDDYIEFQYANGETFDAFGNFEAISGEVAEDIEVKEPGIYKLIATRTRNRASIDGESIEYRVTNAPAVPVYAAGNFEALTIVSVKELANDEKILAVEWDSDIESDEFTIVWYLSREKKDMDDLAFPAQKMSNNYRSEFNPTDALYTDIFEAADEDVEGYYYAIISNTLNGVTSDFNKKPAIEKMFSVTAS